MLKDIEKGCRQLGIFATAYYSSLEKYKCNSIEGLASIAKNPADKNAKKL